VHLVPSFLRGSQTFTYINHRDDFQRHNIPTENNSASMTCLLRKSSLLTFTICANRLPRHEGQLTTFNHFDRRLRECSLASLRWIVVSTGGATDSQKLSMNSLKTIVVLPRLLQQTRGRVSRKSPAYHIDDRADGLERGAFMHEALLLKGVGSLPTPFRTVEVANCLVFNCPRHGGASYLRLLPVRVVLWSLSGCHGVLATVLAGLARALHAANAPLWLAAAPGPWG
jgi:hypothetical protein